MEKLTKDKIKVLVKIKTLDNVIKGSIYEMERFCGKKNCKCARTNIPHKSLFLSFKYNGRTKLIPIKKNQIPNIKQKIKDYSELKKSIDELAKINSEFLRFESK